MYVAVCYVYTSIKSYVHYVFLENQITSNLTTFFIISARYDNFDVIDNENNFSSRNCS